MTRRLGPRDESVYLWGERNSLLASAPYALPGDQPHYPRDRVAELRHIKVAVSFDLQAKQVIGTADLVFAAIVEDVRQIELDAEDMSVNSVMFGSTPLDYTLTGRRLIIDLREPPPPSEPFNLVVDYVATPLRGIYFTGPDAGYPDKPVQIWTQGQDTDNHHWFPCIDEPKGRLTSEIIATVPEFWTAISNGRLESTGEGPQPGTRTFHWVQDKPHAVYLITLAAAEFSRVVLQESGPLIDFYCQPGREDDARRAFENTPAMIKLYEELFGEPYPWDKYTQVAVQDFIFGGMENTSATTQTDLTLHDERAHKDFSSDFLVAHEAVHQWFGDLLTCREWAHGWLNEGFATYFESVWQEHHYGLDEHLWDILSMARGYISERYRRSIVENVYRSPVDLFDRHLYEKGGLVLHMLRRELGDALFYRTVRHYVQRHRGANVLTIDLQRAVEEATGRNLDWFFDQWVHRPGHPQFKVSYNWDDSNKTATLNVRQTQNGERVTKAFRAAVDVAFVTSQGRQVFRAKLTEREHTLTYTLSGRPKLVQFDPGYSLLKELEFDKSKDLLTYQLQRDEDVIGRIEAAQGLGKLATPEAVAALKRAILKDQFWAVQATAAKALGRIRTNAALDALLGCVKVEHPKARRGVADALAEFKDGRAARALEALLDGDESYYVAMTAAGGLGKTKWEGAYDALVRSLGRDSHMDAIRSGVFAGLAELRDERAITVSTEWSAYGRPQRAREAAIRTLGKLGENKPEVLARLADLLDDPWLRVRHYAVAALEELKEPKAIPALSRVVDRELDGRIVRAAREAITNIRAGKSPPDDVKKLRDDFNKLEEENRSLRQRLEKLEQQTNGRKPRAAKRGAARAKA